MGCCNPRPALPPDAPPEERIFGDKEAELGYNKHQAQQVLAVIKANTDGEKVLHSKFNTITVELKLNTTDIDSPGMPMATFYQKFKKEGGKYDALKLAVLGVLLSRGASKAALYFDAIGKEGAIESADVRLFFDTLFFVSAEALPLLAAQSDEGDTPASSASMPAAKVTELVNSFKSGKDGLAERYTNLVMKGKGKVTSQDFVTAFEGDENLRVLTTPFAVRTALKNEAKAAQPGKMPGAALSLLGKGLLGGLKK